MFRQAMLPAFKTVRQPSVLRAVGSAAPYSKATFVGRLGAVPEVRETADGKSYVKYPIAVSGPPKKDAAGETIVDEQGYPKRDTDWFTIFSFRPNSADYLTKLEAGNLLVVEARVSTRKLNPDASGVAKTETVFSEISTKTVSKPKSTE